MPQKPIVMLMILDGFGYREDSEHNAILQAHAPTWQRWSQQYPHITLDASGHTVGLPADQMGNSEVGHMHMGAGRVIYQELTKINHHIDSGLFSTNTDLLDMAQKLEKSGRALHIMGLLSDGGVHSHQNHLYALLDFVKAQQIKNVYLHLFLDGRDTPPQSAAGFIKILEGKIKEIPQVKIASISGRYYAMDRDKRFERTTQAYECIKNRQSANHFKDADEAIQSYYHQNTTDEFIPPTIINEAPGIQDDDVVLFFNFRADRARQLTHYFLNDTQLRLSDFISFTQYAEDLHTHVLFPPQTLNHTLGEVLSQHHIRQLRLAETEKYAHVTFFFNGGQEAPFPFETRCLIPSPKVATYDLKPEMSANEITDAIIDVIRTQSQDVIIVNYANADMVGHSGNLNAAIKAIEALDQQFSRLNPYVESGKIELLITADHGNAELMFDNTTHQPHTAHTHCPVPFVYVGKSSWQFCQNSGSLIDVAPTVLRLLNLPIPSEMTGHSLIEFKDK